ncbi:MAG: peroxiredoxin family protein [Acidimicrobiia bacterium]
MTLRIGLGLVLVLVVAVIAFIAERRRSGRAVISGHDVPEQIDRNDFGAPDADWLVVLFSSADCGSCETMRERVTALGADDVAVYDVEFGAGRAVHERYGITAVPTTVMVDREGVVRASWVGAVDDSELADALGALRDGQEMWSGGE